MKSTADKMKEPPRFTPVVLTITIESQKELDALGALFNSGIISDVHIKMGIKQDIWKTLQMAGADLDPCQFEELLRDKVKP